MPLRTLPEQAFRRRARMVAVAFCAVCLGLAARLFYLQLRTSRWYTDRALGQQLRDTVVPADRGKIYSADGVLLAANSSCWTLRASPREMPDDKLSLAAEGLADILDLDAANLLESFRDRRSNDCLLRYRVDRTTADRVRAFCEANGITGIRINQDSKRWYPQGQFLASVLGFTNVDNAGVSGLELQYDGLVSFEKDTEGHITAVQSNMAAFNHLQAEILDTVLTRISQVPTGDLSIPIGSLTGSTLLAGRGPRITVRMESVGSSEANFRNAFTSAGINQTKHQIILTVDVSVSVLLPGFRTATKVSNSFIVAETVIVGTVPDTYTYFSTDPDTYEEDLKDYILNNS